MTVLQLHDVGYFLACVEGGSLLAGAKKAHVTAAAMTKALQRLEATLEVTLMTRSVRGARLTAEGERLVGPLRALLEEERRVREDAVGRAGEISGELRILAMEVFSLALLPRAIARLVRAHPNVVPKSYESFPQRMVELVATGRADVALTVGRVDTPAVEVVKLGTTRGLLVCGADHPLRGRVPTPRDLATHASVVPRFWGAEQLPSLDQFPDDKWPRRVGATIELLKMAVAMVEAGPFLGFFPEITIRDELASGSLHELSFPAAPQFTPSGVNQQARFPGPSKRTRAERTNQRASWAGEFELVAVLPPRGARPAARALIDEVRTLITRGDTPRLGSTRKPRKSRR